ncbi:hypothetical protein F4604DRAFT_1880413 [Suillus subluteus]|nr:hypothetical protein F4604DRAFT_1880413 [Suillus subluteus]
MQTIKGQTALHGAFLWRQVDTVIELKQNWRAKDDAPFVDMLNRIHVGKARKATTRELSDYDTLKSRLLSELNPYEVYCARDKIGGKKDNLQQQKCMWKIQSLCTNDALGELPLIPGMPVMITENAATSCKIVNGSKGILKSITYESALHVPDLDRGMVPILAVTNSFRYPTGEKTISIRRTQLPIVPGWAFTGFKVQGSSLNRVIIDLTWACSLQSIYVMLSWAPKLSNIAILRWFSSKTLNSDLQGDAQAELKCLSGVAKETRQKYVTRCLTT